MKRLLSLLSALAFTGTAPAGVVVIGNLARTAVVQPGGAFDGVIFLKNNDAQPADMRVFQTDYLCQADGTNDYGQPGQTARSNANWISVTPTRIKLAPGETVPVRYKGRAPADAKLRGTYWSMIMVEPNTAPALTPVGQPEQIAVGLQTTIRFGIQIVTELGQSGSRSLRVVEKRLVKDDGNRSLQLDISNDGERLLIPSMTVELFDKQGTSVGRFEAGRARIYPACSVRAKVDLTGVPSGKYAALVLLDSGDAQVMGAQYDLEIATDEVVKAPAAPLVQNEIQRVP